MADGTQSTCDELDAELSRLLLDDPVTPLPQPPQPPQPPPAADAVVALEHRVAALEQVLDERLAALQSLADERIYAAAVDAAHAVRRVLFEGTDDNADASQAE
jgi:hypothetical protein